MSKSSFVIMESWALTLSKLDDEIAGKLIKAICEYQATGEMTSDDGVVMAIFAGWKSQIDTNNEIYEETCRQRSEAGKKGMTKRWGNNKAITNDNGVITNDNGVITNDNGVITNDNKGITKITDTDTDTDTDKDIKEKKSKKKFEPPTLEEVKAYCQERQNKVDPQTFIDFYDSKGWMIGKNHMKDWKAAVRTWEKRDDVTPRGSPKNNTFNDFQQNTYDYEELERRLLAN